MEKRLNRYSSQITQQKSQGASQAMLYATGLEESDMSKPQVGICSMWLECNPCNMHLLALSEKVKKGVEAAGMVDTNSSLYSREVIADSIESVMSAQCYDGNISIPACDKNLPGCIIAMG